MARLHCVAISVTVLPPQQEQYPMSADLKGAWQAIAATGLQVIPVRVHANPDSADCHAFADDLDLLERRVVGVLFKAYADAAAQGLGVPRADVESFVGTITDAIGDLRGAVLYVAEQLDEQKVA